MRILQYVNEIQGGVSDIFARIAPLIYNIADVLLPTFDIHGLSASALGGKSRFSITEMRNLNSLLNANELDVAFYSFLQFPTYFSQF